MVPVHQNCESAQSDVRIWHRDITIINVPLSEFEGLPYAAKAAQGGHKSSE